MDQFLGAAVTGLELEQLQAVVMQLSQEIGAERVIEACAAQAALAGKPGWLVSLVGLPAGLPAATPAEEPPQFTGVIGMCDDETFGDCMKASTFGFPSIKSHVASLQRVKPGAKAFLFHLKKRVLFGPFTVEAVVPPDERDRELWGSANGKYPNQVRCRSEIAQHRRPRHTAARRASPCARAWVLWPFPLTYCSHDLSLCVCALGEICGGSYTSARQDPGS